MSDHLIKGGMEEGAREGGTYQLLLVRTLCESP